MSKEFDLNELQSTETTVLDSLPNVHETDMARVDALTPLQATYSDQEEEAMEDDTENVNSCSNIVRSCHVFKFVYSDNFERYSLVFTF